VAVVSRHVQKQERDSYTIKEKQYKNAKYTKYKTRIQNRKTNTQRILNKISKVIRKYQTEANNARYCTEPTHSYISVNQ
jgi:hypothetical protein